MIEYFDMSLSRKKRSRIACLASALMLASVAAPLHAQTDRPFIGTLAKMGATPEELTKFSEGYDKMSAEEKACLDKNHPNDLSSDSAIIARSGRVRPPIPCSRLDRRCPRSR